MNRNQITRCRLWNQQIAHARYRTPSEVVAVLGAMQAQDYAGALWAIGLRLPDATQTDVERAIANRTIIRTWPMRGTLHFVAAADVRWLLELLGSRAAAGRAGRLRQLELDGATLARSGDVIVRALEGGRQRSRSAIFADLEAAGIAVAGQRGYHILGHWAQHGLICFGVHEDKQPTFVLLAEWAPQAPSLARDEALAELAARYFTSHGPATLQDFVAWSGLTLTDARAGISLAAQLIREESGGVAYWMAQTLPAPSPAPSEVYLLPGFDEYMLGYRDRSAALDPQHAPKITPGSNGVFQPTVVVEGQVAGVWKRTLKKASVRIDVAPFALWGDDTAAGIAAAAARYGHFIGQPVSLQA